MRKFKFELELEKIGYKPEENNEVNHKVTFERYLQDGLSSIWSKGLDNKTRREYLSVLKKLDESIDGLVNLEETEFDLVNSAFNKGVFKVEQTRLIGLYLQAIEGAQKI